MRVLQSILLAIVMVSSVTTYASYAPSPVKSSVEPQNAPGTCESVKECITYYSKKYDVPVSVISTVAYCESSYNPNAINSTSREYSVGISQINLMSHPHITEEQAKDIHFALDFMAKNISEGKGSMWSCYNKFY